MKYFLYLFVVLLVAIQTASALKCYLCQSTESFSDCDAKRTETPCVNVSGVSGLTPSCAKITYKLSGGSKFYGRSCNVLESVCKDPQALCKVTPLASDCDVNCCESDLCNSSTTNMISGMIIMGCVVFSWIII